MKITFVVPTLNLSGGLRVVSIYARLLSEKGHQVTVVSPNRRKPSLKERIKNVLGWKGYVFNSGFDESFFKDIRYKLKVLNKYRSVIYSDVPDADVVIATWWETAEWISTFPESKGEKFYFVQHHETHNATLPINRVEQTYSFAMYKITIANWLVKLLKSNYKAVDVFLVPNSVDTKFFNAPPRKKQLRPTVGFLYSEAESKGVKTALSVIDTVKRKIPSLRVLCFGVKEFDSIPVPSDFELKITPTQNQIRELYAQCDVWLCCSSLEGFGLTVLEAMACRTPSVSTKCGGPNDIIEHAKSGYLCDVDDISELSEAVLNLLMADEEVWASFSFASYEYANSYSWSDSACLFEDALRSVVEAR